MLLHQKYSHLERIEDLLPLSLRILRFKMMGAQHKSQRHGEYTQESVDDLQLADDGASPELQAERRETAERLIAAMKRLGPRRREMIRLKLAGKSFEEIRTALGAASINTVYTWDFRCRKQLLEWMGGSWGRK